MDPYATHLAPLVETALATDGPIIELGCGDYSTPILAAIARHKGNAFSAMTSSREWGARFEGLCRIIYVDNWLDVVFPDEIGLAFVDNEQKTRDRILHLPALRNRASVVVLHDIENCMARGHWAEMVEGYTVDLRRRYAPGTGILRPC